MTIMFGHVIILQESLSELEFLTRSWPKDPNVCISKGKVGSSV